MESLLRVAGGRHPGTTENHSKGCSVRNYSQADWERVSLLIESIDWSSLFSKDVNEVWSSWCEQLMGIMEHCIPNTKLPKRENLPWLFIFLCYLGMRD